MNAVSPARSWLIERLVARHAELERALEAELARPRPDDIAVRQIKREKLLVRDRIAALERSTLPPWMTQTGREAPVAGQAAKTRFSAAPNRS